MYRVQSHIMVFNRTSENVSFRPCDDLVGIISNADLIIIKKNLSHMPPIIQEHNLFHKEGRHAYPQYQQQIKLQLQQVSMQKELLQLYQCRSHLALHLE